MTNVPARPTRLGIISDTHGLLRPQALTALRGCERILHAGDVGRPEVLHALNALAPVTAVRGNNDKGVWADELPVCARVEAGQIGIYLIHDLAELDFDPAAAGIRVVISGHSHQPSISEWNGVLYVNPGSAGPRRFKLPIAVAELIVDASVVKAEIIALQI